MWICPVSRTIHFFTDNLTIGTLSTLLTGLQCQAGAGVGGDAARNRSIRIQCDSRECNLVKRNTNTSISTEVMNSTNTRKQLTTEEAYKKKEMGSLRSQISITNPTPIKKYNPNKKHRKPTKQGQQHKQELTTTSIIFLYFIYPWQGHWNILSSFGHSS